MSIKGSYLAILKSVKFYEDLLDKTSEEVFLQNPSDGGWSYSEVYSHVFQSNLMSLIAIERCLLETGESDRKATPFAVRIILFLGMFPPGRIKAPSKIAALVKKISREEARNLLVKFKQRLSGIESQVKNGLAYQKVKHPRLGLLNSIQWFRFIEIHTRHHTNQLRRISAKI